MSTYDTYHLSDLGLSTRAYRALRRYGISTIQELIDLYETDKERIKRITNIGELCFNEIETAIQPFLKEGVKLNDNMLTDTEQQLYDELTKLINDSCYPCIGVGDRIIAKLDELVEEFLRR